ncbi:pilin [Amphibiibacter pelophylacis]|uniref:Pilin n=1 Tax=Amphibiibacter pelophylacis TaxID=1799477 RepID=A0ACC6NXZ9_9BURK
MTPRRIPQRTAHRTTVRPHGFTLVELMVAVAIIGILAAVALPAYQDYAKRSRVTEGLTLASGAKTAVTEYYANNGAWPTANDKAGLPATIKGKSVDNVQVGADGVITVTFSTKVDDATHNLLTLTPQDKDGSLQWACAPATDKGVKPQYLPSECKTAGTATG